MTFSGSGFDGDANLTAVFQSDPVSLGMVHSDANGAVLAPSSFPATRHPGAHQIVVTGPGAGGGVHRSVGNMTVVAGSSGTLPVAGSDDVGTSVTIGLLLAVVGACAAWWGRSAEA